MWTKEKVKLQIENINDYELKEILSWLMLRVETLEAAEQSVHPTCAICGDTGVAGPTWSHPEGEACEYTRG